MAMISMNACIKDFCPRSPPPTKKCIQRAIVRIFFNLSLENPPFGDGARSSAIKISIIPSLQAS